jgi:hypothetical protein
MATRGIRQLPIYPEDRASKAPTAPRVFDLFGGAARHLLICDGDIVRTYQPPCNAKSSTSSTSPPASTPPA